MVEHQRAAKAAAVLPVRPEVPRLAIDIGEQPTVIVRSEHIAVALEISGDHPLARGPRFKVGPVDPNRRIGDDADDVTGHHGRLGSIAKTQPNDPTVGSPEPVLDDGRPKGAEQRVSASQGQVDTVAASHQDDHRNRSRNRGCRRGETAKRRDRFGPDMVGHQVTYPVKAG